MTKKEYEKTLKIIEDNMVVIHDSLTLAPRIVLTTHGLSKVKNELKEMVKNG